MLFSFEKIAPDSFQTTVTRTAVRAIVLRGQKLLVLASNKGDFKLPGGGLKDGETHRECLARELREECGATLLSCSGPVGLVVERRPDRENPTGAFEMVDHFFLAEIDGIDHSAVQLEAYEQALEMRADFVDIGEVIAQCKALVGSADTNPWLERELEVFMEIKKALDSGALK